MANREPEIQDALRLFLEIGKLGQRGDGGVPGAHFGFDLVRGGQVVVVIRVDEIKHHPFRVGGENRAFLVNPFIQLLADGLEVGPVVGVMIDAVTQNEVVELPNGLLNVFGDLKTLQLHRRQLVAQLAGALPGSVGRPGDQDKHSGNGQNERDQSVFNAAAHQVNSQAPDDWRTASPSQASIWNFN